MPDRTKSQEFAGEPLLMTAKRVMYYTGSNKSTLHKWTECGVLELVRMAGMRRGKFRKRQVAALVGFEELV